MYNGKVLTWSLVISLGGFLFGFDTAVISGAEQSVQNYWSFPIVSVPAAIAFSFPWLAEKTGGGNTFLFFAGMMLLQLLFVWKFVPETRGKSLEQLEKIIVLH